MTHSKPEAAPNTPHRLDEGIRSKKKRTETNKRLPQPSSSAISLEISANARLSCAGRTPRSVAQNKGKLCIIRRLELK
jgi:hypothetical protein